MGVSGKSVVATGLGVLFIWSGIKGWSILGTLKDVIAGHAPAGTVTNPLSIPSGAIGPAGSSVASGSLADLAKSHVGHAYSFGGAPGKSGANPWDCSSMVNWLVSVGLGGAIPGYGAGKYDGSVHGPITTQWGIWPGLTHVDASQVQAGDIVVWTGHMGVAVDNTHMVSALNEDQGTLLTPIAGYGNGPLMCYGRLTSTVAPDKGAV